MCAKQTDRRGTAFYTHPESRPHLSSRMLHFGMSLATSAAPAVPMLLPSSLSPNERRHDNHTTESEGKLAYRIVVRPVLLVRHLDSAASPEKSVWLLVRSFFVRLPRTAGEQESEWSETFFCGEDAHSSSVRRGAVASSSESRLAPAAPRQASLTMQGERSALLSQERNGDARTLAFAACRGGASRQSRPRWSRPSSRGSGSRAPGSTRAEPSSPPPTLSRRSSGRRRR